MSHRRSSRMARRRKRRSQATVRAITQRCRPSVPLGSIPTRAMRTRIPRRCRTRRQRGLSHPVSACSLSGRVRRCPPGHRIGGYGINEVRERNRLVPVGSGHPHRQRQPLPRGDPVVRGTRFAAVGGIRPGRLAPLCAGMLLASTRARSQSSWSAAPIRSSSTWCRASQTPAVCQSRSRRPQVMPLPPPSSCGNSSQGMLVRSTKGMPVRRRDRGCGGGHRWAWGARRAAGAR